MNPEVKNLPSFLLDTGPLSVLCGFPINGIPYIQTILPYITLMLPDAVANEIQGAGKLARVVSPLIKNGQIRIIPSSNTPSSLDENYQNVLGAGERAVIKCATEHNLPVVIDDKDAFVTACRFGLHPMIFLILSYY